MTKILGISAFYHDSASCIINEGEIIAAAQEERFSRIKHDQNFPSNAIKFCLKEANISLRDLDHIIFYEKPILKFERLLQTYLATIPFSFKSFRKSMPLWIKQKLFQKKLIEKELLKIDNMFKGKKILFADHHRSHAASAFFPSPFNEAVVLTMDGVGEWTTTSVYIGKENQLFLKKQIQFPHSLGLLYSAFTYYLGFKVNSGEYKVMGLAPYGKPTYEDLIFKNLIKLKDDGSFKINMNFFDYCTGLKMINKKFESLFKKKARDPETDEITGFHMNIAASIQSVINKVVLKITESLFVEFGIKNLCIAGGVGLNCVSNGLLKKKGSFKNIWVQPAAGDAGGALGSALICNYEYLKNKRLINKKDSMKSTYLGPSYTDNEIQKFLEKKKISYQKCNKSKLINLTIDDIINQRAVGWMQGRMEFGPRSLGNRSILADPRSDNMQSTLNLKIKFRESFRPFAPSVIIEKAKDFFDLEEDSPYMLFTFRVKKKKIPAITHVDKSARIHTVSNQSNKLFYQLLEKFYEKTGYPILINTSFNIRGEPIVCSPEDAYNCFMGTNLDSLVIGSFFIRKEKQRAALNIESYKKKFSLD